MKVKNKPYSPATLDKETKLIGVLKAKSFSYAFHKIENKFGLRWLFLVGVVFYLWPNVNLVSETLEQPEIECYIPRIDHGHVGFTQDEMTITCDRGFFVYPWLKTNKCTDGAWENRVPQTCTPFFNLTLGIIHTIVLWGFMPYVNYLRIKAMFKYNRFKFMGLRMFIPNDGHQIFKEKDFRDTLYAWLTPICNVCLWGSVFCSICCWYIYGSETIDESEEYYMLWTDLRLFVGILANFGGMFDLIRVNCSKNISLLGIVLLYITCAIPNWFDVNQNHLLLMYFKNVSAFDMQVIGSRIVAFPVLFGHALYVFGATKYVDLLQLLGCFVAVMGPKAAAAQMSNTMPFHRSSWMAHMVVSTTFHLIFQNTSH